MLKARWDIEIAFVANLLHLLVSLTVKKIENRLTKDGEVMGSV